MRKLIWIGAPATQADLNAIVAGLNVLINDESDKAEPIQVVGNTYGILGTVTTELALRECEAAAKGLKPLPTHKITPHPRHKPLT